MIIITVNYNTPHFLEVQLPLLQRNCEPETIHVINTGERDNGCKEIAESFDCRYAYLDTGTKDFSQSHALALNIGYSFNRQLTDIIGIVDHDCFPVSPINIPALMVGAGLFSAPQIRNGGMYPNPACMFVRTRVGALDFMPCDGMDTAGQLRTIFWQNKLMKVTGKPNYELFADAFIHIVKGSNWVNKQSNLDRVNQVFEYVKTFLQ